MTYQIHADYTGAFPLQFPFNFNDKAQALVACETLNTLRLTLPSWAELKAFQVWDSIAERFVA